MALNYAEKYEKELLEIVIDGAYTSPFITSNVDWLDAKTFKFTQMSTSGYKNHSRNGGWNAGTFNQIAKPFTVEHDRDIEFLVDKADVDETAQTAAIQNISRVFTMTQQVPEMDAVFFEKVAAAAKTAGKSTSSARTAYAKDKVLTQLKKDMNQCRRYKNQGMIVYVDPEVMDNLEMSTEISKKIDVTTISESGAGIQTRVATIDGVPVMEIIDTDRFYDKFDYSDDAGGFKQAADGMKLLVVVATPKTVKTVPKISSIYYFAAGKHTKGDGDLYQNRAFWDTFVFPNGKDGNVDSVYTVTETGSSPTPPTPPAEG